MRWVETVSHEIHVPQQGLPVSLELVAVDYCKEWGCSNFENWHRAFLLFTCTFLTPGWGGRDPMLVKTWENKSNDCLELRRPEGSDHTVTDQSHLKKDTLWEQHCWRLSGRGGGHLPRTSTSISAWGGVLDCKAIWILFNWERPGLGAYPLLVPETKWHFIAFPGVATGGYYSSQVQWAKVDCRETNYL